MVTVRVPATIANLGPAFDALGVAVGLYNTVSVELSSEPSVTVSGYGEDGLPRDATNLVYQAATAVAQRAGRRASFRVQCRNDIPPGRGLGSSAAAIVGGAMAANEALGRPVTRDDLLDLVWHMEGHPDNVAASLLGGVVLTVATNGTLRWTQIIPAWKAALVVAIPEFSVATAQARAVLPQRVPLADAVANVSRTAWLVTAMLTGRPELLATAMEDRLHQPYRRELVPGMEDAFAAARQAGAYAAALCGSGPSVLAVTPPGKIDDIGQQMVHAFQVAGHQATYRHVTLDAQGATVLG